MMDEISSYYKELSFLQLKYEHLVDANKSLLKPWPIATNTGQEQHSEAQVCPSQTQEDSSFEPHSKELEQIDALLNKAQKIRIHNEPREEKCSKKSTKLASSVYGGNQGDKSAKIQNSKAACGQLQQSVSGRKQSGKVARTTAPVRPRFRVDKEARKSHDLEPDVPTKPQGFSLRMSGTQLSMPSEYRKLHKLVSRCGEVLGEDMAPSEPPAAAHYSKRLLSKHSGDSDDRIRLLLASEEISFLKGKLLAVSPSEWTVSHRSNWEDVLALKTKIDLLLECYHVLSGRHGDRNGHYTPTLLEGHGRTHPLHPNLQEFGYSSLKDWTALSSMELQKRHKQWEAKYLRELQHTLLPAISQHIRASPGQAERERHTAMLRALYLASGIHTNPVYLDLQYNEKM